MRKVPDLVSEDPHSSEGSLDATHKKENTDKKETADTANKTSKSTPVGGPHRSLPPSLNGDTSLSLSSMSTHKLDYNHGTLPTLPRESSLSNVENEPCNIGSGPNQHPMGRVGSYDHALSNQFFPPMPSLPITSPHGDYGHHLYDKLPPGRNAAYEGHTHLPPAQLGSPSSLGIHGMPPGAFPEQLKFSRHEEAFSHPEHAFSNVVPTSPQVSHNFGRMLPVTQLGHTHFGSLPLPSLPTPSMSDHLSLPHRDVKQNDDMSLDLPSLPEPSLSLTEYTKIADQLNQLDNTIYRPLPTPPGVDLADLRGLPALPNIDVDLPPALSCMSPEASPSDIPIKEEPGLYSDIFHRENKDMALSPKIKITKMRGKEDRKRYEGVYHHKNRWVSKCNINKKQVHVGYFDTLEEAVAARQKILKNPEQELPKLMRRRRDFVNNKGVLNAKSSQVRGVSYNAKARKWHAQLAFEGKNFFLGYFKTEAEAAEVRFAAEKNPKDYVTKLKASRPPPAERHSFYTGVSWHSTAQKWRAIIRHNMKTHYLGCFDTEEEAFEARMIAAQNLHLGIDAIKERLLKKKKGWCVGGQARKESRQKGVTRYNRRDEWWARYYDGKRRWFIGSFKTEKEAVEAYMKVSENPQEELKKLKAKKDAKMRSRTKIKKEEFGPDGLEPLRKRRKRNRTPVRKKTRLISEPMIKQEGCYSGAPDPNDAIGLPALPDMKDVKDIKPLIHHDPVLREDVKRSWEAALAMQALQPEAVAGNR